jgi:hypothetical protein
MVLFYVIARPAKQVVAIPQGDDISSNLKTYTCMELRDCFVSPSGFLAMTGGYFIPFKISSALSILTTFSATI